MTAQKRTGAGLGTPEADPVAATIAGVTAPSGGGTRHWPVEVHTNGNPVLAEFNMHYDYPSVKSAKSWLLDLEECDGFGYDATLNATPEQVEEARRILTHIAGLGDRDVILK